MAGTMEREEEPLDAERVRKDFPILERTVHGRPLVYLDSANTSQKPRQVIDAVVDFYEGHNANIHRAVHTLGEEATEAYEAARAAVARFIGAPDPSCIVFNRGTTESLNLVAHAWGRAFLREGDEVLLTEMEHHSNIVPWQLASHGTGAQLRYVPITDEGRLDMEAFDRMLTERTKVVGVTGMSNVLGTVPPLRRIADAAHAVGAVVVVDGAQLSAHAPVNVVELDCDFLTISGHKTMGPTASGGLYGKRDLLEWFHDVANLDGIATTVHHARQREIGLCEHDFQLRHVEIVHSQLTRGFRAGEWIRQHCGGPKHLIHIADFDSVFRSLADVDVIRFSRQHASCGVELRNHLEIFW